MEDPDASSADGGASSETPPDESVPEPEPAPPETPAPSEEPEVEPVEASTPATSPEAPLPPPPPPLPPLTSAPAPGGPAGRGRTGVAPSSSHVLASAVTLVLSGIVAAVVFILADFPDDYLTGRFAWSTALLVVVAVPVALLFAWGEVDLSFIGTMAFGAYIYIEVGDSGVAAHLLLALLFGIAAGAATGLVRYLTAVPSAMLTFIVGLLWIDIVTRLMVSDVEEPAEGMVTGLVLPMTLALLTVGASLAVALVGPISGFGAGSGPRASQVDPRVIVGFALSGAAASTFGAAAAASTGAGDGVAGFVVPGNNVLFLVVAVVAVGGVVRGGASMAPVTAALATMIVALVAHGIFFIDDWKPEDGNLLLTGLAVATLGIAHGVVRLVGGQARTV